jgi:hypothetical protein
MSRILSALLAVVLFPVWLLWLWHERRVLRVVRCDGGEGQVAEWTDIGGGWWHSGPHSGQVG